MYHSGPPVILASAGWGNRTAYWAKLAWTTLWNIISKIISPRLKNLERKLQTPPIFEKICKYDFLFKIEKTSTFIKFYSSVFLNVQVMTMKMTHPCQPSKASLQGASPEPPAHFRSGNLNESICMNTSKLYLKTTTLEFTHIQAWTEIQNKDSISFKEPSLTKDFQNWLSKTVICICSVTFFGLPNNSVMHPTSLQGEG